MSDLFYFGCTVKFLCATCGQESKEQMIAEANENDPAAVRDKIIPLKLKCQKCLTPIRNGTPVDLNVRSSTLEQLKAWGFALPAPN